MRGNPQSSIKKGLKSQPDIIDLKKVDDNTVLLHIGGNRDAINEFHFKFNKNYFDNYKCIRIRDDLGLKLRIDAYPYLSEIELELRYFINRTMIEVIGFDWWDKYAPIDIVTDVAKIQEKNSISKAYYHPLEFSYFRHLYDILSGSVQEWKEDKSISVSDLVFLIEGSATIDECKTKLDEKIKRISLWESIFSKYFSSEEEWKELETKLRENVIPIRHKVMHHRAIFSFELEKLKELAAELHGILEKSKLELTEKERENAKELALDYFTIHNEMISAITAALGPTISLINQHAELQNYYTRMIAPTQALRQQEEAKRRLYEATVGPIQALRQQEVMKRKVAEAAVGPVQVLRQQEEAKRRLYEATVGPTQALRQQEAMKRKVAGVAARPVRVGKQIRRKKEDPEKKDEEPIEKDDNQENESIEENK
jgi:hypothetical protein